MKRIFFITYIIIAVIVSLAFIALSIAFAIQRNDMSLLLVDILPIAFLILLFYTIK